MTTIFVDDSKKPEWYGLGWTGYTRFFDGITAYNYCLIHKVDTVYLDYDLGDDYYTGLDLLRDLILRLKQPLKKVICISMKPDGVERIRLLCSVNKIAFELKLPPLEVDTPEYGDIG